MDFIVRDVNAASVLSRKHADIIASRQHNQLAAREEQITSKLLAVLDALWLVFANDEISNALPTGRVSYNSVSDRNRHVFSHPNVGLLQLKRSVDVDVWLNNPFGFCCRGWASSRRS